jgi:hypothetical protein
MPMDVSTIIIALIGGGAVGFIQFLISRHDAKRDKNKEVLEAIAALDTKIGELDKKIEAVDSKVDERAAVSARVRILRFMDELLEGRRHSKDAYDQCLSDATFYDKYCSRNPDFKNNQTEATISYIRKNYDERLEKHDFL